MNICVYGAASDRIDEVYKKEGYALGRKLGERGHRLVFGGGNSGMMGAVVRGISSVGGESYGVSPEFFRPDGIIFENSTKIFFTADMRARKAMLDSLADGFIISAGGTGTLDELFEMFTLKRLNRSVKPIVILNTNGFYNPLIDLLNHMIREGFMNQYNDQELFITESVDRAIEFIEKNGRK